jgi:hypothetical protein
MKQIFYSLFFTLIIGIAIVSCGKTNEISDLEKTAALKNVTVQYDSCTININLPQEALTKTYTELKNGADSLKYRDPACYSVSFDVNSTAYNTKNDAEDAKFESTILNLIMDTIKSTPLVAQANGFEVLKNTSAVVPTSTGTINLKTHRRAMLYIFAQTVAGNNLKTTIIPLLGYKVGSYGGFVQIPSITANIPTRADENTKRFLKSLLDSKDFAIK